MPVEPDWQHVPPPDDWFCVASWSAELRFDADASESTLFDWDTEPSFPGLPTRTGTFVFDAFVCVANDSAAAACWFAAVWLEDWMPVEPDPQHAPVLPADCDCVAS